MLVVASRSHLHSPSDALGEHIIGVDQKRHISRRYYTQLTIAAINADKAAAVELDSEARHELERNERLPEMQGGRLAHQLDRRNERLPELQTGREAHEVGTGNATDLVDRSGE
jgi:hypothetical protein